MNSSGERVSSPPIDLLLPGHEEEDGFARNTNNLFRKFKHIYYFVNSPLSTVSF